MEYSKNFFLGHRDGSLQSAREIVPIILNLIDAKSVVDVGCASGEWLSVFRENGIEEIMGIDGAWVSNEILKISPDHFVSADLKNPLKISRKFDLVISLEVAEHLPEKCAETFVGSLTELGPVVVFSAAIPFQGGNHHINEKWPEYWIQLFLKRKYLPIDCIRKIIWNNKKVCWWYSQNIMVFVKDGYLKNYKELENEFAINYGPVLSLVHPDNYLSRIGIRSLLVRTIPDPIVRLLKTIKDSVSKNKSRS